MHSNRAVRVRPTINSVTCFIAVGIRPHDAVESDEVIDVVVRDEHRLEIAELLHRQRTIVAAVEEDRVVANGVIYLQHRRRSR